MTNFKKEILDPSIPLKQTETASEYDDYESLLRTMLLREKLVKKITLKIRQSLKLSDVLNTAVEEIRSFIKTDRVILYQFKPDWTGFIAVESVAKDYISIAGRDIKDECFAKNFAPLYQDGRVRAVEDIYLAGLALCHIELLAQLQVRANLVIPMLHGSHLWGLLIAHHCQGPRNWENSQIEVLKQLIVQLEIAIKQADLYEKLQFELNLRSTNSSDPAKNPPQTVLQEFQYLLQREDISWDNLADVVKQALSDALQGKITWH
jgi:GAF domain-containing protein